MKRVRVAFIVMAVLALAGLFWEMSAAQWNFLLSFFVAGLFYLILDLVKNPVREFVFPPEVPTHVLKIRGIIRAVNLARQGQDKVSLLLIDGSSVTGRLVQMSESMGVILIDLNQPKTCGSPHFLVPIMNVVGAKTELDTLGEEQVG